MTYNIFFNTYIISILGNEDDGSEWYMVQVTSGDECWLLQRNLDNFKMLDDQLHQCIYDRKIFQLPELANLELEDDEIEVIFFLFFLIKNNLGILDETKMLFRTV